jgi:hypothetical protein
LLEKKIRLEPNMKKLITFFMLAVLLSGGALAALPAASQAQVYPPPSVQPVATPWVGPNTPWVYYNGDWFLNGVLQYFFGPRYGWAPYYAYPRTYIVRPGNWYAPKWHEWYRTHPVYWDNFHRSYPYWRNHQVGHHYDQNFYERHHHGQGGGWHHGWHGER